MRIFKYSKLVRDNIVNDMMLVGDKPLHRTLDKQEFIEELKNKILEEAKELSGMDNAIVVKELVDIQEAMDALLNALAISKEEFAQMKHIKTQKKGAFNDQTYIDTVEVTDKSPWIKHYLNNPQKYPELKKG